MEYMCHGDLLGFLRASRGHSGRYTVSPGLGYQPPAINLYPRDLLNIGAKIANGMHYLADRKVCTSSNIHISSVQLVIISLVIYIYLKSNVDLVVLEYVMIACRAEIFMY